MSKAKWRLPGSPRIAVLGPLPPWRGGISQYNVQLLSALGDAGARVNAYSFLRQYPRWLYPGRSDRDSSVAVPERIEMHTTIDSLDPRTWRGTARAIAALEPDLVLIHWWTAFWALCFWTVLRRIRRDRRRIVMICHNVADHDGNAITAWMAHRVQGMADGFLVHSSEAERVLRSRYPGRPIARHPIPVYGIYPSAKGLRPKRGRLELLYFGFIRPYKGVEVLLRAMAELKDREVYLTIVGEPWGEGGEAFIKADLDANIETHLKYATPEEVAEFFGRADYVILPYLAATGSAVAAVAQFYGKPVIASNVGGLPDVVTDGVTGKLVQPGDVKALTDAIRASSRDEAVRLSGGVAELTRRNTWESLARSLLALGT